MKKRAMPCRAISLLLTVLLLAALPSALPGGFARAQDAQPESRDVTIDDIGLTFHYYAQNDARWARIVYKLYKDGSARNNLGNGGCNYITYVTMFDMMGYTPFFGDDYGFVKGFLSSAMYRNRTEINKFDVIIKRLSNMTGRQFDGLYADMGGNIEATLDAIKGLKVGEYAVSFLSDIYNTDGRESLGRGSAVTNVGHYLTIVGHSLTENGDVAHLYIADPMLRPTYESYIESYQRGQAKLPAKERQSYERNHGYAPQDAFDIIEPGIIRVTPTQFALYFNYNQGRLLAWGNGE